MIVDENCITRQTGHSSSISIGGPYFPFVLLLLIYAAIDLLAPCVLQLADTATASPYWHDTTITDGLGGSFSLSGILRPKWINSVIVALVFGAEAQRAILVVWTVFGLGRWYVRFGAAWISTALLYGIVQVRLGAPLVDWKDAVAPYLAMPLEFLSVAAPFTVFAVWSGRRLQYRCPDAAYVLNARHFSIANMLWVTAVVAAAVTFARWNEAIGGNSLSESVLYALVVLIFSTIYVLPLTWAALVVRRSSFSLFLLVSLTALFFSPVAIAVNSGDEWTLQIGIASGILLTVPGSLLLWRLCDYRLSRAAPVVQSPPSSAS